LMVSEQSYLNAAAFQLQVARLVGSLFISAPRGTTVAVGGAFPSEKTSKCKQIP
jgi:hypothetical protein